MLGVKSISTEDLAAEAEATDAPTVEQTDESLQFTIPIGTEAPIECEVFNDELNPAAMLDDLVRRVPAGVTLQHVEVAKVSSGLVDNRDGRLGILQPVRRDSRRCQRDRWP